MCCTTVCTTNLQQIQPVEFEHKRVKFLQALPREPYMNRSAYATQVQSLTINSGQYTVCE